MISAFNCFPPLPAENQRPSQSESPATKLSLSIKTTAGDLLFSQNCQIPLQLKAPSLSVWWNRSVNQWFGTRSISQLWEIFCTSFCNCNLPNAMSALSRSGMAQIKQHKIDIFMRIELQFQKCNFSPISIKSLGICGFLLVTRSLCFLNVSVIVFFFVFVIVIVFLLDMSCPIIALITCFKGLSGCFFAVFSKVWMARSFLELSCEGQLKTFLHN